MTMKLHIQCPTCNSIYTLRYQMDMTIYDNPWKLHLVCKNCGDSHDIVLDPNEDIIPKELKVNATDKFGKEDGIVIGYSNTLPIYKDVYYIEPHEFSIANFSPFMTLARMYPDEVFTLHGMMCATIRKYVFPIKDALLKLLPIMQKSNVQAYEKKWESFGLPKRKIDSNQDCVLSYENLVLHILKLITPANYDKCSESALIQYLKFLNDSDSDSITAFGEAIREYIKPADWLRKEGYISAGKFMSAIDKFYSCMFYASSGEYIASAYPFDLRITSVGYEECNDLYELLFETMGHALTFLVAMENAITNGDANDFKVPEGGKITTLAKFDTLSTGSKLSFIDDHRPLTRELLSSAFDIRIRNGIDHGGVEFDNETQTLLYHYGKTDETQPYARQLIDVGFDVYLQAVHVLEVAAMLQILKRRKQ